MEFPELPPQLQGLPKPMVAAILIFGFIILLFVIKPRHTICDSQLESVQASQAGFLFPKRVGQRTQPAQIQRALEMCRFGNSSGSCYEYFDLLRRAAMAVKNSSSQCTTDLMGIGIEKYSKMEEYGQVRDGAKMRDELANVTYQRVTLGQVFADGLEIMVQKAWGEAPPEPGPQRFGWFHETELNTLCHVRDVLIRAKGRQGFQQWAHTVYAKLPGEAVARQVAGTGPSVALARRATLVMSDAQAYERSVLSAPCDSFR